MHRMIVAIAYGEHMCPLTIGIIFNKKLFPKYKCVFLQKKNKIQTIVIVLIYLIN